MKFIVIPVFAFLALITSCGDSATNSPGNSSESGFTSSSSASLPIALGADSQVVEYLYSAELELYSLNEATQTINMIRPWGTCNDNGTFTDQSDTVAWRYSISADSLLLYYPDHCWGKLYVGGTSLVGTMWTFVASAQTLNINASDTVACMEYLAKGLYGSSLPSGPQLHMRIENGQVRTTYLDSSYCVADYRSPRVPTGGYGFIRQDCSNYAWWSASGDTAYVHYDEIDANSSTLRGTITANGVTCPFAKELRTTPTEASCTAAYQKWQSDSIGYFKPDWHQRSDEAVAQYYCIYDSLGFSLPHMLP